MVWPRTHQHCSKRPQSSETRSKEDHPLTTFSFICYMNHESCFTYYCMKKLAVCPCAIAAGAEKGCLRREVRYDATQHQTPFDSGMPVYSLKLFLRVCSASHHDACQRRHVSAIHLQWPCWQSSLLCLYPCWLSSQYCRPAHCYAAWLYTEPHGFCQRHSDERAGRSEAIYCGVSAANQ